MSVDAGFVAIALLAFAGFYGSTTRTVRQLVTAGIDVQAHCRLVRSAASGSTISDSVVPSDTPIKLHTYDELRELGLMMLQLCTDLGQSAEEYARSQDAMRSARDEAEAANRTKTDFLSRTSHELRTPLNSIMGFAQVLDLQDLSQRQKDSVGLILRSGKHLLAMIDEILDLARIENRDMSISVEPVPVGSMLRDAMALVGPLAKEKEVQIDCEVVGEDLCVQSDRKRLLQVLLNLLANAIKYNVVRGFVSLKLVTGDGRVQIEIADTGVGIAEDQLDQLFFPFARLGKEMGEIEGSGLGLALSRGLVETMNGTLTYRPNKPVGSVFVVNLPVRRVAVATAKAEKRFDQVSKVEWSADRRILLIEDNVANVELMRAVMELRPRAKLIVAMKGLLGLELIQKRTPDLVLLDLNLPDVGGKQVLAELRQDPNTAAIPVIVMSADAIESHNR